MKLLLTVIAILFCTVLFSCKSFTLYNKKTPFSDADIIKRAEEIINNSSRYNPAAMIDYYNKNAATIKLEGHIDINSGIVDTLLKYAVIKSYLPTIVFAGFDQNSAGVYADSYNAHLIKPTHDDSISYKDIINRQTYIIQLNDKSGNTVYAYISKLCPPPPNCDFSKLTSDY